MTLEELKIRQMTNQYLLAPADKLTVMRDLCGVQAQFMTNALHSLKIRTNDYDEQTVADGLVKNWSVRGTVHVFAESDLPLFIRCNNGADYRKNEWQGYSFMKNQRLCWALTPERQKYLADIIISAVSERAYTRDELKELCRANGMTKIEEDCLPSLKEGSEERTEKRLIFFLSVRVFLPKSTLQKRKVLFMDLQITSCCRNREHRRSCERPSS